MADLLRQFFDLPPMSKKPAPLPPGVVSSPFLDFPFPDVALPDSYRDSRPPRQLKDAGRPYYNDQYVEQPLVPIMPLKNRSFEKG